MISGRPRCGLQSAAPSPSHGSWGRTDVRLLKAATVVFCYDFFSFYFFFSLNPSETFAASENSDLRRDSFIYDGRITCSYRRGQYFNVVLRVLSVRCHVRNSEITFPKEKLLDFCSPEQTLSLSRGLARFTVNLSDCILDD